MLRQIWIASFLSVMCVVPSAWADRIGVFGLANYATPTVSNGTFVYTPKLGYGAGLDVGIPLGTTWALDIGGIFTQRKFAFSATIRNVPFDFTNSQNMIEVPVLARWWVARVASLGFGFYYAKYIGSISQDQTNTSTSRTTTLVSNYAAANQKTYDAGLVVSLRLDIPVAASYGLLIDGRYQYGLTNNAVSGSAFRFTDMQGLVGLRFGMVK